MLSISSRSPEVSRVPVPPDSYIQLVPILLSSKPWEDGFHPLSPPSLPTRGQTVNLRTVECLALLPEVDSLTHAREPLAKSMMCP